MAAQHRSESETTKEEEVDRRSRLRGMSAEDEMMFGPGRTFQDVVSVWICAGRRPSSSSSSGFSFFCARVGISTLPTWSLCAVVRSSAFLVAFVRPRRTSHSPTFAPHPPPLVLAFRFLSISLPHLIFQDTSSLASRVGGAAGASNEGGIASNRSTPAPSPAKTIPSSSSSSSPERDTLAPIGLPRPFRI